MGDGDGNSANVRVDVRSDTGRIAVRLDGEVDLSGIGEVRRVVDPVVASDGATVVELDMTGVSFIDSTGIEWLLHLRRLVGTDGTATVRVRPSPTVQRLLDVTGLAELFTDAAGGRGAGARPTPPSPDRPGARPIDR